MLAGFPEALKVAAWSAEADVAALWAVSEEDLARLDAVLPGAPFVLRPIRPREVLMRLRHLGKRRGRATPLRLGPLEIDSGGGWVRVEGREVVLTAKEFALLVALADRAGAFVSRERLMAEVWSLDRPESRTLAVHIRRLRVKLGPAGRAIETRVKQGYRLVPGLLRPAPSSPGLGGGGPPDWAGN